MDNYNFLTKEETIICLTTKETDELEQYNFVVIERDGYMFFIRKNENGVITATLINYDVIRNN